MLVYFVIGLGALAVLFLIEAQFFVQVTQHVALGYGIAAIFEVAKIGTSIIKQAIIIGNRVTRVKVSALIHGTTGVFQVALIVVSLMSSMVVVTCYLEGSFPVDEQGIISGMDLPDSRGYARQQSFIASTLTMLKDGLHLNIKKTTFISILAVLISALFQATSYIVFAHVIAMQSREIEHIFEVKMHRLGAKKNFMPNV